MPTSTRPAPTTIRSRAWAVAASTVASRITGFGRVFALAYALSFTRLSDAYNLANTTPNIVYTLVLGGVFAATLVPVFVDALTTEHTEDEAWHAISAVVSLAGVVLLAATTLLMVAAPTIVSMYSLSLEGTAAQDQQAVATTLLRLFSPQVAFYGVITLSSAILNAKRRFVAPMLTPVLNNLIVIVVLVATPHVARSLAITDVRHDKATLLLLGAGTTAGVVAQAATLLVSLRRSRVPLRPVWAPTHPIVVRVLRLSGWTVGYVAANQVSLWVVLTLANGRSGDVSTYQAAYMFFQLPYAVVAVTVSTMLVPEMARKWVRRDVTEFTAVVSRGLRLVMFLVVPAAIGFVMFGPGLVRGALDHGAVSSVAANRTGSVLAWMAIGLPAFAAYLFLMSAYQAMQNTRTMFLLYCVENLANVVFAMALYPSMGVRGLALSFAGAYSVGLAGALCDLHRRIGPLAAMPALLRIATAGITGTAVAALVVFAIDAPDAVRVVIACVCGGSAYLATAYAIGSLEARHTLDALRRAMRLPA